MRHGRVGGVVSGSVSIINAKKNIGAWRNTFSSVVKGLEAVFVKIVVPIAKARKLNTRSNRWIFRVIRRPPARTTWSIGRFPPIHQLADRPIVNAVKATANAAGLKRCFLFGAIMYFDAIAQIAAQMRKDIP